MVTLTKLISAAVLASSALAQPLNLQDQGHQRNVTHHRHGHGHGHHHEHYAPPTVKRDSSSKRGASYNEASLIQSMGSAVSWAYDWNMYASGNIPSGVEYVPMLWGSKMFDGWLTAIETALASGSKYIMGFNEPDMPSQANMSPSDAASAYQQHIQPFSGKAKLVTPAVTNNNDPNMGLQWMQQFLGACQGCSMSALAVHWYGTSADDFKSFVTNAENVASQHGIPEVWVTEFALNSDLNGGSTQETVQFLEQVLPWLDSQSSVTRYAYFMCASPYLLSGNGLSAAGQQYIS